MSLDFSIGNEVIKKWGKEIIFANNDNYCGKILCIDKGKKFSMHFHIKKDETWYVKKGLLLLKWVDTNNAQTLEKILVEGSVVRIVPGIPHQLIAQEYSEIYEVSTTHYDDDSYRIGKGDSQL